ncbi:MAG: serpin family protein, partial [Oscillospiraceae bacterium]
MKPEASKATAKLKKSRRLWLAIGAAAVCTGIVGGIAAMNLNSTTAQAARPVYPEMAEYPNEYNLTFDNDYENWWNDRRAQGYNVSFDEGLWDFCGSSTRQFLSGTEENRVYSPVNLYMALSMLAEITDGESRQQILDLLSAGEIDELREQAGKLWNANYCDDGAITSILGNSVWLDKSLD